MYETYIKTGLVITCLSIPLTQQVYGVRISEPFCYEPHVIGCQGKLPGGQKSPVWPVENVVNITHVSTISDSANSTFKTQVSIKS